ncbi:MAG TPA: biphenyl 2,3-dioxygenase [bacterium]
MKRQMLKGTATLGVLALALVAAAGSALAKGDMTEQKAIPILLTMGSKDNKMIFTPNKLKFETGKLYKLLLVNEGTEKHEFDSTTLRDAVFSHKVEVVSPDGVELAEIVGSPGEIEVAPGVTVEWYFVPVKAVKKGDIICDMPGHLKAGMKATFSIE